MLSQEPLGSSPFLTLITGSLQNWNRRVRPLLLFWNGTSLASRVVHRVTGHLPSCIWNLQFFLDDATGVSVPLRVLTSSTGLHFEEVSRLRVLIKSGRGNQCLLECGMTQEATSRISL